MTGQPQQSVTYGGRGDRGGFVLSMAAQQGGRVSAAVPFHGLPSVPVALLHDTRALMPRHPARPVGSQVRTATSTRPCAVRASRTSVVSSSASRTSASAT